LAEAERVAGGQAEAERAVGDLHMSSVVNDCNASLVSDSRGYIQNWHPV